MNKSDRMRAFSMRCDGMTWEQIGGAMNYDARAISRDLQSVMEKPPRMPAILYPAVKEFVRQRCFGSIEVFANIMRVSPHRLRRVLVHGDKPTEALIQKIAESTGLTREEVLRRAISGKAPSG